MFYVGLDVHRRRTQVAVLDENGHELFNRNVPNDRAKLSEVLVGCGPGTPVVFEACYGWSWLAELLEDLEFEADLAHPAACKAIAYARLKNDRVDARILAHLLRTDLLGEAWIAPRDVREVRMLLRHRTSLVRLRTSLKTRIRAVLADRGIDGPVVERPCLSRCSGAGPATRWRSGCPGEACGRSFLVGCPRIGSNRVAGSWPQIICVAGAASCRRLGPGSVQAAGSSTASPALRRVW